jgi:hypothetical protein
MTRSPQFAHHHDADRVRLNNRIPVDCPLIVRALPEGFAAMTLDGHDEIEGRYQVVAAYVDGYVAAWKRLTRRSASCPAE